MTDNNIALYRYYNNTVLHLNHNTPYTMTRPLRIRQWYWQFYSCSDTCHTGKHSFKYEQKPLDCHLPTKTTAGCILTKSLVDIPIMKLWKIWLHSLICIFTYVRDYLLVFNGDTYFFKTHNSSHQILAELTSVSSRSFGNYIRLDVVKKQQLWQLIFCKLW